MTRSLLGALSAFYVGWRQQSSGTCGTLPLAKKHLGQHVPADAVLGGASTSTSTAHACCPGTCAHTCRPHARGALGREQPARSGGRGRATHLARRPLAHGARLQPRRRGPQPLRAVEHLAKLRPWHLPRARGSEVRTAVLSRASSLRSVPAAQDERRKTRQDEARRGTSRGCQRRRTRGATGRARSCTLCASSSRGSMSVTPAFHRSCHAMYRRKVTTCSAGSCESHEPRLTR